MNENTINIGHFCVCFSEKRTSGLQNPYHNPGYVHLFCIEKFLKFPQLVLDLNVKADTRKFETEPRTKGPGPIELDRIVKATVLDFIAESQVGYPADFPLEGIIVAGTHEGTLTNHLHVAKLDDENPVRARACSERGGIFTHDSHLGNLRNIQVVKAYQRRRPPPSTTPPELQTPKPAAPQPTPQLSPPPPAAPRKRGRPNLDDWEYISKHSFDTFYSGVLARPCLTNIIWSEHWLQDYALCHDTLSQGAMTSTSCEKRVFDTS
ncbi:MAG: hypothetical protein M1839_002018 [Geoglossum umbratile]|nr:MAG: hypothetical protein M1839_002018 [Geoglossum umbratile]